MKAWLISMSCRRSLRNIALLLAGCFSAWAQTPSTDKPAPNATPTPPASVVEIPAGGSSKAATSQQGFDATNLSSTTAGEIKILSDTMGVDFGPYMKRLKIIVQDHWEPLIPLSARPPMSKSGSVIVEFAIMKDGAIRGMRLVQSSGDVEMDRASWGAITSSIPLPALPPAFKGEYLRLRCRCSYNPGPISKTTTQAPPGPTPQAKQEPPK